MDGTPVFQHWWTLLVAVIAAVGSTVAIAATVENWLLTARRRRQHETLTAMREAEPDTARKAILNRERTWVAARQVGAQRVPTYRAAFPIFLVLTGVVYTSASAARDPWQVVVGSIAAAGLALYYGGVLLISTITTRGAVVAAFLASNQTSGEARQPHWGTERRWALTPSENVGLILFIVTEIAAAVSIGIIIRQHAAIFWYGVTGFLIAFSVSSLRTPAMQSYPAPDALDPTPPVEDHSDDRRDDA